MLLPFPKATILALIAALALLTLAIACATAATPTPVPTATAVPTVTLVPTATALPTPTPAPDTGNWMADVSIDAITDAKSVGTILKASESTLDFPYDDPTLLVVCRAPSRRLGIFVEWGEHLGSGSLLEVAWRVNSERPSNHGWFRSGDSIATVGSEQLQDETIQDLLRAEKITARVKRDFAESITAVWHPAGFAEAYKPVADACNLTIP